MQEKMGKSESSKLNKPFGVIRAVNVLLIIQEIGGEMIGVNVNQFSYKKFALDNIFAWQSAHHVAMLLAELVIVVATSRLLKDNVGFQLRDHKKGERYFALFSAARTEISFISHILMYFRGRPLTYNSALNTRNVIGR